MNGVMTFLLVDIVRSNPNLTYGVLLDKMHTKIEELNQERCNRATFLKRLFNPQLFQVSLTAFFTKFDM